jgi:hypothetical protein
MSCAEEEEGEVMVHNDHMATCLCCTHLMVEYEGDYSELTPGQGFFMTCCKGHFYVSGQYDNKREYHENLLKAQGCPDFEALHSALAEQDHD